MGTLGLFSFFFKKNFMGSRVDSNGAANEYFVRGKITFSRAHTRMLTTGT
jgi:hypothetical protein